MTDGVLLATYGSPTDADDVGRYLEHIIGREPTEAQVEGLAEQYRKAGGLDALREASERQAKALASRLDAARVEVGHRHSPPWIADVVEDLGRAVDRGVVVPLAPHYNTKSVEGYLEAARDGLARLDEAPPFAFVESYHDDPDLVAAWADRVRTGLDAVEAADPVVLFTAHSLPATILDTGDPYPKQVRATCRLVAEAAGVGDWRQAWQSAPPHGDWLEPDVGDSLAAIADDGHDGVVVAPVGFVSDHMETRYDLDVEAAGEASDLGLAFERVPAPDADERFIDCLANVVAEHLGA